MQRAEQRKVGSCGWAFIDLAGLGINTAQSYAAAAAIIVACPVAAATVLGLTVGVSAAVKHSPPGTIAPIMAVVEQYGPIIVAGAAVLYSVAAIHHRPWRSLIAPSLHVDWRRLAIGGGVELALLVGQLALVYALVGWPSAFSLGAAVPLLAVGLLLVPLQAASEEILFRGYLTQSLGRAIKSRLAIAFVVALAFGLLHLNVHGPLTVPYFLVVSLIFSLVSLRDDRLELAIGGHAGMNLFAFTMANSSLVEPGLIGTVQGGVPINWAAVAVLTVNGALFYGLTRFLVRLFCDGIDRVKQSAGPG